MLAQRWASVSVIDSGPAPIQSRANKSKFIEACQDK